MMCGQSSLVNYHAGGAVAISLRCRAWTCENCADMRKRQLIALAMLGQPERFITLTVTRGRFGTPDQAAVELANAWRLIAKRIRRRWPAKPLEYLAVFEATKNGWPHLHILQRGPYVPQRWLSAACLELLGSPICDIRAVTSRKMAVRYVAKYVGKQPHRFGSTKRYWTSGRWLPQTGEPETPAESLGGTWQRRQEPLDWFADNWRSLGKSVVAVDDWCCYHGQAPPWLRAERPPAPDTHGG